MQDLDDSHTGRGTRAYCLSRLCGILDIFETYYGPDVPVHADKPLIATIKVSQCIPSNVKLQSILWLKVSQQSAERIHLSKANDS